MLWNNVNKVVALAFNYRDLNENEQPGYEYPAMFMKSPTSLVTGGREIHIPKPLQNKVWAEVELGITFDANYKFYYFVANDISAFNVNNMDVHLAFSKAVDYFCPIGTTTLVADSNDFLNNRMYTLVNDEIVQEGNTKDMWYKPTDALAFISEYITLIPRDVILTGTCKHDKVILKDGDMVTVGIEGLGEVTNRIVYK